MMEWSRDLELARKVIKSDGKMILLYHGKGGQPLILTSSPSSVAIIDDILDSIEHGKRILGVETLFLGWAWIEIPFIEKPRTMYVKSEGHE